MTRRVTRRTFIASSLAATAIFTSERGALGPLPSAPRAGARREDTPAWWKKTRAMYCPFANSGAGASLMKYKAGGNLVDRMQSFLELPKILDEARRLGSDTIYVVDYWEPGYEYKGEYVPYARCGGAKALEEGIAAVHSLGGRVIVYLEAFIISRRTDFGRRVGPRWAMMDEAGNFYPYFHTGDRFYLMYPGEGSGWTEHIVGIAGEMARRYRIDGVHLDSYGLQWGWKDFHPDHPGGRDPATFNNAAVRLVKQMRAALREHRPEAVVILEGAEQTALLEVCDGAQIESLPVLQRKPWWQERKYPIFTSSFELLEMQAILDAGYQLALSPWWLTQRPRSRDTKRLQSPTDKRNRFDQIESLNIVNNLLVANGIEGALPRSTSERIHDSIVAQLNRRGWTGEFENPELASAAKKVLALYDTHRHRLTRSPADELRAWLREGETATSALR